MSREYETYKRIRDILTYRAEMMQQPAVTEGFNLLHYYRRGAVRELQYRQSWIHTASTWLHRAEAGEFEIELAPAEVPK